jgi:hypothetical protein
MLRQGGAIMHETGERWKRRIADRGLRTADLFILSSPYQLATRNSQCDANGANSRLYQSAVGKPQSATHNH